MACYVYVRTCDTCWIHGLCKSFKLYMCVTRTRSNRQVARIGLCVHRVQNRGEIGRRQLLCRQSCWWAPTSASTGCMVRAVRAHSAKMAATAPGAPGNHSHRRVTPPTCACNHDESASPAPRRCKIMRARLDETAAVARIVYTD